MRSIQVPASGATSPSTTTQYTLRTQRCSNCLLSFQAALRVRPTDHGAGGGPVEAVDDAEVVEAALLP